MDDWRIPGKLEKLEVGVVFGLSLRTGGWRYWRRSDWTSVVLATDDEGAILHLRMFGNEPSIEHLPVLRANVEPFVTTLVVGRARRDLWEDDSARAAVAEWREERSRGTATAFNFDLGLAIRNIRGARTAPDTVNWIHSAYPIVDANGRYQSTKVVEGFSR